MCYACKKVGHRIEQCDQDPNFKTTYDGHKILVINEVPKAFKRLFGDSQQTTGSLLKNIAFQN